MKSLMIIIITLISVSCGSVKVERSLATDKEDSLKNESFDRYNSKRLVSFSSKSPIKNALSLCYMDEVDKGLEKLKNIVEKNQSNPLYWNSVAICNQISQKNDIAKFYFGIAFSVAKKNRIKSIILNNEGVVALEEKKNARAERFFTQSISLNRNHKSPRLNLARYYLEFGIYTSAFKHLYFLQKKHPKDIDVNLLLAKAYLLKRNLKKTAFFLGQIPNSFNSRHDIANIKAAYLIESSKFVAAKSIIEGISHSNIQELETGTDKLNQRLAGAN